MTTSRIITGDCLDVMPTLRAASVHAVVTDCPYGLQFMGASWDHGVPGVLFWEAALRVAKPGAFLLAFGGTRTVHRLACAIEDAGWEIRDCIMWLYGSGFPKSLDVSKAIDKAAGVKRERIRGVRSGVVGPTYAQDAWSLEHKDSVLSPEPITDAAKQWDGWGTSLKPAYEPIIVARKPLDGTVANNVLKHGCGGLNVDACRIGTGGEVIHTPRSDPANRCGVVGSAMQAPGDAERNAAAQAESVKRTNALGRWPANVVHDGSDEVVALMPDNAGGGNHTYRRPKPCGKKGSVYGGMAHIDGGVSIGLGDSGSAARFFYCAKASRSERNAGCGGLPVSQTVGGGGMNNTPDDVCGKYGSIKAPARNHHPTVKPLALMEWLVKLVTPPGGTVLDPFMGSGTTGIACGPLGFNFIGIEKDPQYVEIARARIRERCGLLVDAN